MDNKSDDQLLIIQANIEANRKYPEDKMKNLIEYLTGMIASMMGQIKFSKSSPYNKDSPKAQYPTTVVLSNKKVPPLEGGHYTQIGGMWNVKHEIRSPKLYELLINIELKVDTYLYIKNFYNHVKMYFNAVASAVWSCRTELT